MFTLAALVVAMACATAPMPPVTSVVSSVNTSALPLASDAAADSLLVDVRGSTSPLPTFALECHSIWAPHSTRSRERRTPRTPRAILARRLQLTRVMESQGFVNYAQEWWHFSYAVANEVPFDRVIR